MKQIISMKVQLNLFIIYHGPTSFYLVKTGRNFQRNTRMVQLLYHVKKHRHFKIYNFTINCKPHFFSLYVFGPSLFVTPFISSHQNYKTTTIK